MKAVKLSTLKKGDFFTLKPIEEPQHKDVYVRGDYCRELKRYSCEKYAVASNERFLRGDKIVYVDFFY